MSESSIKHFLFSVRECESDEHDELIKELAEIHNELAIAVALPFFGVDWDYISIGKELNINWALVKGLFDTHCKSYHICLENGEEWKK